MTQRAVNSAVIYPFLLLQFHTAETFFANVNGENMKANFLEKNPVMKINKSFLLECNKQLLCPSLDAAGS
jgi:hypothetical protein